MSRVCSVVDSNDCEASADGMATGPVVTCWACGDDTCRACSSIVEYRWRGQRRRMRLCFNCQDSRGVGRDARCEGVGGKNGPVQWASRPSYADGEDDRVVISVLKGADDIPRTRRTHIHRRSRQP